jgi:hypothetical protein
MWPSDVAEVLVFHDTGLSPPNPVLILPLNIMDVNF